MKICVVGGAGYVGSVLVPYLLRKGHHVSVLDQFWFGDHLGKHERLTKWYGDIRNRRDLAKAFKKQDAVIHLACVSNDPSFDMNPSLGKAINYTCFRDMLTALQDNHIARFIYASSSSVYGVSPLKEVTEDSPKNPLTDYSKFKLACEKELHDYGMGGVWTILRPATVCGYSPRLRLDLVVNIFAIQALAQKRITLFGRNQKRPNINIKDMVRAYEFILDADETKVDRQIFNVGDENMRLIDIAARVQTIIPDIQIDLQEVKDPRSYHVNSDKIAELGFTHTSSITHAIMSIKEAYEEEGLKDPINNPQFYNIKRMKELGL